MNAFTRRGACPALSAPMQTGDGLLVRLNPVAGGLSPKALIGLCNSALKHGNGVTEVTARGSFQIRGLTESSAAALAREVDALGIVVRTGVPVESGRLAGLDPTETADPTLLAERIRAAIEAAGLDGRLGPKVSVVVDGGGRSGMDAVAADVRLTAVSGGASKGWLVSVAGDAGTAKPLGVLAEERACEVVIAILAAVAARGIEARARDLTAGEIAALSDAWRSMLPPSVLPDSGASHGSRPSFGPPTRGEIRPASRLSPIALEGRAPRSELPISPLVGGPKDGRDPWLAPESGRTEGGAKELDVGESSRSHFAILALSDGRFALGIALPFGHVNARQLIDFATQAEALGVVDVRLAPKRSILSPCPTPAAAKVLREAAERLGFIVDTNDPRGKISACPGAPACASGHIAARDLAGEIADIAGKNLLDGTLCLHVSGCAKGCAHPGAATLTVVGSENGAGIVVGGTARSRPLAYTSADGVARGVGRIAKMVAEQRGRDENAADCVARLGPARIAEVFGKQ